MHINLRTLSTIFFALCFAAPLVSGQELGLTVPADVRAFVGKDKTAIGLESADLNGDGLADYILVVENTKPAVMDGSIILVIHLPRAGINSIVASETK